MKNSDVQEWAREALAFWLARIQAQAAAEYERLAAELRR